MLLFLNALKGLKKKKVQMGAIILMVMLSTGIYVAMNSSLDRLENRYYEYLDEQKVELFSFSPVINYKIDISSSDMDEIDKTYFVDVLDEERVLIDTYWECLDSCSEEIYGSIGQIFNKYGANDYIAKRKLDGIVSEYDFYYTKEVSKIIKDDKRLIKAIPYNSSKSINIPYLVEGAFPSNDDEITILPNYAKSNGIVLGDLYKIGNKTYKIVGYAYASDYIYPMISLNVPIFDEKNNNIVFLSENSYNEIVGLNDDTYVARFNYDVSYEDRMMAQLTADDNKEQPILKLLEQIIYKRNLIVIGRLQMLSFIYYYLLQYLLY